MNEEAFQEQELRAAEYVLGTLAPDERADVDAALGRGDRELSLAIVRWEARLGRLAYGLQPVSPPAEMWPRIENALQPSRATTAPSRTRKTGYRPALALAASLAVAAVATTVYLGSVRQPPSETPAYASLIRDQDTGAGWLITASRDRRMVEVTALKAYATPAGKSLELWLLAPEASPVSVGLLPANGKQRLAVPAEVADKLSGQAKVAVSLEPAGGSPTGQPTGEVLWVAPLTGSDQAT